nr:MAG TPA: hypothetical protein [Caudoviricetes sp.]
MNFELGDLVHCTRYIRKSGNRYEVIPAEKTQDGIELALFIERGAKEPVEIYDSHVCDSIRFVDKQFDGVFVGTTTISTKLSCEYNEPAYGFAGWRFEKYNPIKVAIVYFARGQKRLVPLDSISPMEVKKI